MLPYPAFRAGVRMPCRVGNRLISAPTCCAATRMSCAVCRLSQNCALVPNQCPKRSAVSGHRALALNDLRDPVRRNLDLPRQFGRRNGELLQFVAQDFAGMDRWSCHRFSP